MNHTERLEWDTKGRCKYRVRKTAKCTGPSGFDNCLGHYNDDYGSSRSCPPCGGSGTIRWFVWVRVPEFDADRPPSNWIPDWIEE